MKEKVDFDEEKLRQKAEEALDQTLSTGEFDTDVEQRIEEMERKKEKIEQEAKSEIPFTWDPREIQYFNENRKKMDNEELKEFLQKDSEIQKDMREMDDWDKFSRREERFIVQNHLNKDPEEIAEELDRDEKKLRMKMRILGLKLDDI